MKNEYLTQSTEQTEEVGEELAKKLLFANKRQAFIAMRGEMGVGKTAFVRGFCRALGITGVKSPTYTIVNEYRGERRVFHFDMYRIESEDDLCSIGYDDYVNAEGFSIAEWCENIEDMLPEDVIRVDISRTNEEFGRKITVELCASMGEV